MLVNACGWMGGLVGGGGDGQQPEGSPTPGRRQHLELDPGAAQSLQTLPFPSSPASVPSPRSPSTRSHPPAYHIPTNTHTMDNASTQDNQKHNLTIIQCWLSTQPREPFFEEILLVCGHGGGGGFKRLTECRHHKRYFQ